MYCVYIQWYAYSKWYALIKISIKAYFDGILCQEEEICMNPGKQ